MNLGVIRWCIPDHSLFQWTLNIDSIGLVEQLKNWQTVESMKFDLLALPEDFMLNDNAVVETNVLVEWLKSNSLTQADIDRIYEDFSDLVL